MAVGLRNIQISKGLLVKLRWVGTLFTTNKLFICNQLKSVYFQLCNIMTVIFLWAQVNYLEILFRKIRDTD